MPMEPQPLLCYNLSMSFIISLEIAFLAMLIHAFLQLSPSVFAIFYHYALGKKSSRTADDFSIFYILGVEVFSAIIFILVYSIFFNLLINHISIYNTIIPWILSGILFALGIASFFLYFKKGRTTTELFIPRRIAKALSISAKNVKNRSDAFVLGLTAGAFELIFSLPLYIIVATTIMEIDCFPRQILGFLYIIIITIPTFAYLWYFHRGFNLAELERRRIKNKSFIRLVISVGYFLLACLILIGA